MNYERHQIYRSVVAGGQVAGRLGGLFDDILGVDGDDVTFGTDEEAKGLGFDFDLGDIGDVVKTGLEIYGTVRKADSMDDVLKFARERADAEAKARAAESERRKQIEAAKAAKAAADAAAAKAKAAADAAAAAKASSSRTVYYVGGGIGLGLLGLGIAALARR